MVSEGSMWFTRVYYNYKLVDSNHSLFSIKSNIQPLSHHFMYSNNHFQCIFMGFSGQSYELSVHGVELNVTA